MAEHSSVRSELSRTLRALATYDNKAFSASLLTAEPEVRFEVIKLFAEEASTASDDVLKKSLEDPDHRVKLAAARVLVGRGDEVAKDDLRQLSNSPEAPIRGLAERILKQSGEVK
jgi:HEAT repeat protein